MRRSRQATGETGHIGLPSERVTFNIENVEGKDIQFGDRHIINCVTVDAIKVRNLIAHSPYKGLKPFEKDGTDRFFGRTAFVEKLFYPSQLDRDCSNPVCDRFSNLAKLSAASVICRSLHASRLILLASPPAVNFRIYNCCLSPMRVSSPQKKRTRPWSPSTTTAYQASRARFSASFLSCLHFQLCGLHTHRASHFGRNVEAVRHQLMHRFVRGSNTELRFSPLTKLAVAVEALTLIEPLPERRLYPLRKALPSSSAWLVPQHGCKTTTLVKA